MYGVVKRIIDLLVAAVALILLSPLMLVFSLLIKIDSPGPVLFRQARLGRGAKLFTMYKFRTMQHSAPIIHNSDGSIFVGANDP